jgi:ribosomal protein S18 acetylase RimI-like enzyme
MKSGDRVTDIDPIVRRVQPSDLQALGDVLSNRYMYADRMKRQKARRGYLLGAFWPNYRSPIGAIFIWTAKPEEPELQGPLKRVPLLMHLSVRNDLRGQGVGTRLVQAAEAHLRRRGYRRVALGVEPSNEKAIRLYKKLGYRPMEELGHVKTTHVEFHRRGKRRFPETCLIFIKDLEWPDAYAVRHTETAPVLTSVGDHPTE